MAALASDTAIAAAPAKTDSRLQLRLVISVPVMLILVALAYGLVSYLAFSIFWEDLEKAGAGDIARELLRIHMNALVMLAIFSAAVGLVLSSAILRPVRALLEATRQVAHGRLDHHAAPVASARELTDLSDSFNQMIDTLNHSMTERNRLLMAGMPFGVLTTDLEGRIGAISPRACEILGQPAERMLGLRLSELIGVTPQPAHVLVEYLLGRLGEADPQATAEVTLGAREDAKALTVSSTLLRDGDGQPYGLMFNFRETVRMRDLSAQLSRSDQLAALGTFTLGLAHELRNPLGAIKGFSQLLLLERDLPPRAADFLARMVLEVDRVDGLVRQLFDLSEQPLACRVPTNLNKVLEQATEDVRRELDAGKLHEVKLKLDLRPLPLLLLEHDRLVQAFAKMIQNAYEFTPAGGSITLRTRQIARPGAGPLCLAQVCNSGSAIAPENLRRVFEPFFTTRDKATGLGLTIAGQIVAQNGGRLEAAMEGETVIFSTLLDGATHAGEDTAL